MEEGEEVINHYEVLGVPRDVQPKALRKRWKELVKAWHPDRNPDPEATSKFASIQESHEHIIDPKKRKEVNRFFGTHEEPRKFRCLL